MPYSTLAFLSITRSGPSYEPLTVVSFDSFMPASTSLSLALIVTPVSGTVFSPSK